MTLKELSARIGVREKTARLWVRQGKLKASRQGTGVFVIKDEEFTRFVKENNPQPEAIGTPYYKRYTYDKW